MSQASELFMEFMEASLVGAYFTRDNPKLSPEEAIEQCDGIKKVVELSDDVRLLPLINADSMEEAMFYIDTDKHDRLKFICDELEAIAVIMDEMIAKENQEN